MFTHEMKAEEKITRYLDDYKVEEIYDAMEVLENVIKLTGRAKSRIVSDLSFYVESYISDYERDEDYSVPSYHTRRYFTDSD